MPASSEKHKNRNSWKNDCWSNGFILPQSRIIDITAFIHTLDVIVKQDFEYQLCYGIPVESRLPPKWYQLPTVRIAETTYELHPANIQPLSEQEGYAVTQQTEDEAISLDEWISWHKDEQRPIFLLRDSIINIHVYRSEMSQNPYYLHHMHFNAYRENKITLTTQHAMPENLDAAIEIRPLTHTKKPIIDRPKRERVKRENSSRSYTMPLPLTLPDYIVTLSWDSFAILTRVAGIPDSHAQLLHLVYTKPMSQLAQQFGVSEPTIKKRILRAADALEAGMQHFAIAQNSLFEFLHDHEDISPVEEPQEAPRREKGSIPDEIHALLSLSDEEQNMCLKALPITHKFALIERYNLLRRENTEIQEVRYDDIIFWYPDFDRTQLKNLVSTGLKELSQVLRGEPLQHPPSNELYEITPDIRLDYISPEIFLDLCANAGVEENLAYMYVWHAKLDTDNPYPHDAEETARQFTITGTDVYTLCQKVRRRIAKYVQKNNYTQASFPPKMQS